MPHVWPLYPCRSDGKLETLNSSKRKEPNQPTIEQMDTKPDKNGVSDYYRELAWEEAKHQEWRRKLGTMLARELQAKESKDAVFILAHLPEGFRLFEHIKKSEKDGKTEVKSKSHAVAGSDRQDAYLYGHPSGRRKRFRSPADFFPHLLWLCTDETQDYNNCSCKICCPDELENIIPGAKLNKEKPVKPDVSEETKVKPLVKTEIKDVARPIKAQSKTPEQKPVKPAPPAQSTPRGDQDFDSRYGLFKFRQGEMVWYNRGQAWGLGIVTYRHSEPGNQYYAVQALSYPDHAQRPTKIDNDKNMRPWLAWSVPQYIHPTLTAMPPTTLFEEVDWIALLQGDYNEYQLDIDASILAAKTIDATYTPFNVINSKEVQPNIVHQYYAGMFLGGEKIWLNDPLRLSTGSDLFVVKAIIEQFVNGSYSSISLTGEICSLMHVQYSSNTPFAPANNPDLPSRMVEDLNQGNARSIPLRQVASYYKVMQKNVTISLQHIKGRWYETSLFLPILQEDAFNQANENGTLLELGIFVNTRGDCVNANRDPSLPRVQRYDIRKSTRKEAFGKAFPDDGRIIEDLTYAPYMSSVVYNPSG